MNRGIYATGTGMLVAQKLLDITANNLANLNTNGYKSDSVSFNDAFQRELGFTNTGFDGIGTLGSGPQINGQYQDFSLGPMQPTNNPLDVAIASEKGMFAINTPQGVQYTRDGSFTMASDGTLVTASGHPVLDVKGNPITLPQGDVSITPDGQISVDAKPVAQLAVYDGTFSKQGTNLWSSSNATLEDTPTVKQGVLEASNVNPMTAMIDMIKINRAVEMAQKSIQTEDDSSSKLVSSLSN